MVLWFVSNGGLFEENELLMLGGLLIVVAFTVFIDIGRIRSIKNSQPAEYEL